MLDCSDAVHHVLQEGSRIDPPNLQNAVPPSTKHSSFSRCCLLENCLLFAEAGGAGAAQPGEEKAAGRAQSSCQGLEGLQELERGWDKGRE